MTTTKTSELLVVTKTGPGMLAKLVAPLAQNNINVECFTGYEWGTEAAIRLVTDNNRKAREVISKAGYTVQETSTVVWNTPNTPGMLRKAASALAEEGVNIYCAYATGEASKNSKIAFTTSNADKTVSTLERLK